MNLDTPRGRAVLRRLMATEWYVGISTCGRRGYAAFAAALVLQAAKDELRGGDITEAARARARDRMRRLRGAS